MTSKGEYKTTVSGDPLRLITAMMMMITTTTTGYRTSYNTRPIHHRSPNRFSPRT